MILTTVGQRRDLLAGAHRIAVVGASTNTLRPSYFAYKYLRAHGLEAFGVNPAYPDIDGVPCYPTLAAFATAMGGPESSPNTARFLGTGVHLAVCNRGHGEFHVAMQCVARAALIAVVQLSSEVGRCVGVEHRGRSVLVRPDN